MVRHVVKPFGQQEWAETVNPFKDLNLVQTWDYGEAKAATESWQIYRAVWRRDGETVGACQAMVRTVPYLGRGLVWINLGPLWQRSEKGDVAALLMMLADLRRYWVAERGMYLRIAPAISPETVSLDALAQLGYHWLGDATGRASARLDLSNSLKDLRGNFQQKWRNCLNKAERQELVCEDGTAVQLLQEVLDEYQKMVETKKLSGLASPAFLSRLHALQAEDQKLWSFVARQGSDRVGVVLIARYGQICEYLVGAFNEAGRTANAGNFLLWQAICRMKELGFRWFDVGGMNPKTTPQGIFHFKNGLRGTPYEFMGKTECYRPDLLNRLIRWRLSKR